MSLVGESDVCQKMVETGVNHKPPFMECERPTELVLTSKNTNCIEETMVIGEEVVLSENIRTNVEVADDIDEDDVEETPMYFEENLNACEEITVNYDESTPISSFIDNRIKQEWCEDDSDEQLPLQLECEEGETAINYGEDADEEAEDEETIAVFVTAAGQQLALYAVEDSDEVFAVAVYDESGDPPTNFQFLMKSDVERLIGEGAVRTVKKPVQMKKQLWTTHPPVFVSKQDSMYSRMADELDENEESDEFYQIRQKYNEWNKSMNINRNSQLELDTRISSLAPSTGKQSDITYVMMDNNDASVVDQLEGSPEGIESDNEIVEQSTVQFILFEGDQSDSELTFDEIQATLQNLRTSESKSVPKKSTTRKLSIEQSQQKTTNGMLVMNSTANCTSDVKPRIISQKSPVASSEFGRKMQQIFPSTRKNHVSNALIGRRQYFIDERQNLPNILTSSEANVSTDDVVGTKEDSPNTSLQSISPGSIQLGSKVKRPRKQQLTSVNRGDSEIIIQPASLLSEDDNTHKRRGRRKRKTTDFDNNSRSGKSKRIKKTRRHRTVEVIEIDVDEERGTSQEKNDIIEITIDDNKEKGSSDKENEVIMVGDSDDESKEPVAKPLPSVLQCEHCSRNFRQKRALETHSRVCSKSPSNAQKRNKGLIRANSEQIIQSNLNDGPVIKKQYTCKVCQEKFDEVVALARHVRKNHTQRKRGRLSKSAVESKADKPPISEIEEIETKAATVVQMTRKRKNQSPNRAWKVKQLNCIDCGRWFSSAALLTAHCLQHATKKSDQQIRRCQTCKKLIKSRLLYARHMKMHSKAKKNTKPLTNILQKKLRHTRQVANKIVSLRKRGRPRKF